MSISAHFGDAPQWAQTHFGGVGLGDVRRNRRVVTLAAGWAREPGASIPRLSQGQVYASKAAYQLLGHAQTTRDALQAPHCRHVGRQLQAHGTYLLVEDTTERSWPEAAGRRAGLGPVGPGKARSQGVLLHSLVAAAWPEQDPDPAAKRPALPLLGLFDQQFHVRQPVPEAEKAAPHGQSRLRQGRVRESALWVQSLRAVGSPPAGTRWVVVADRGADMYEHLQQCHARGLGFVVRAAQDRALVAGPAKTPAGRLFEVARAPPSAGIVALALRGRPRQPARAVALQVSFSPPLALRAPQRPGGATGKGDPVPGSVVRVWEETGPGTAPGLTVTELRVLRHQSRRPLATVWAVYLALAALGGHLGRKGDGPPGWQTLWLGRRNLRLLVEGVAMAAQLLDE